MKPLVIFGTGEIGEIAHYYFTNDGNREVAAFTADGAYVTSDTFCGHPVVAFEELAATHPPDYHDMFVALSYSRLNRTRQQKYEAAKHAGYTLASYISSRAVCWDSGRYGDNCFILENQTVQPFCHIGNNVTLWSGNHIGHHSSIGDHTFVSSHVVISGMCRIGERCFFGVNAAFRDNCVVGDEVFVGMGATVTRDLASGSVVLGGTGEVLASDDRRARSARKSFFGL